MKLHFVFLGVLCFMTTLHVSSADLADSEFDRQIRFSIPKEHVIPSLANQNLDPNNPDAFRIDSQRHIHAYGKSGKFYAQNLQDVVPGCSDVSASPHFSYRSMHVDVARHYFPLSALKRFIQQFALLRFNKLQIHLTDDQGWRFESRKMPQLTAIGAYRYDSDTDSTRYGNYYTQTELKDLVAFAQRYHIELIPEIDFPAHSRAVLAAMPHLSCSGKREMVGRCVNNTPGCSTLCLGNPETWRYATDILDELCDVFPSKYIHIGGDECDMSPWTQCPKCQKMAREKNMTSTDELYPYFMNYLIDYLHAKGRTAIVWDEFVSMQKKPRPVAPLVMVWQSEPRYHEIKKSGYQFIMCPNEYFYLDYRQEYLDQGPKWGDHSLLIDQVFRAPVETWDENVLGIGACSWAENITNEADHVYMTHPRLLAVSELAWHGKVCTPYRESIPSYLFKWRAMGRNASFAGFNIFFQSIPTMMPERVKIAFTSSLNLPGPSQFLFKTSSDTPSVLTQNFVELVQSQAFDVARYAPDFGSFPYAHAVVRLHRALWSLDSTQSSVPHPKYQGVNALLTLVDGLFATRDYRDVNWCGFEHLDGAPVILHYTFDSPQSFNSFAFHALKKHNSWVVYPSKVEIWSDSQCVGTWVCNQNDVQMNTQIVAQMFQFPLSKKVESKEFKVKFYPGLLPNGHFRAGKPGWIFLSETLFQ